MWVKTAAAAAVLAGAAVPASALQIVLRDVGGLTGTQASSGFALAARYWESVITNDARVLFEVGLADLGTNVLSDTRSALTAQTIASVSGRIAARGGGSATDVAVAAGGLPVLRPGALGVGAVELVTPGYVDPLARLGIDNESLELDGDGSYNNSVVALSAANARALGYALNPLAVDARITLGSSVRFDFSPADGIDADAYDFVGVAIQEMGHALGFLSGVDKYDVLGCPNGPGCDAFADYAVNDDWWGLALDLFRYSTVFDGEARLDWRPGVDSYFSLDRGATMLPGGSQFSSGRYHGDLAQASSWKANLGCTGFIGVMNPYLCDGERAIVTATDLAAFDAIGWNLTPAAQAAGYRIDTGQIARTLAVPEPGSWVMLIAGFGLVGLAARRRRLTFGAQPNNMINNP